MLTVLAPEDPENGGPENDFGGLARIMSTAIEQARQLNMHGSAYILTMTLAEVWKAAKPAAGSTDGGGSP